MSKSLPPSPFADAALKVDADFSFIEQLAGQLERAPIDSEADLKRAKEFLVKFGECGERISANLPAMARALEEARARAEAAAQSVATRALAIQERQRETDQMLERFSVLGEMIRKITETTSNLPKQSGNVTPEERALLVQHLPELTSQLDILSNEANKLKEDAREANLKTLERSADSLSQRLLSVRKQLGKLADQPAASPLLQ